MHKYKVFRQSPSLCGPASLKTIFDYLGIVKSEDEWEKLSGASRKDGVVMEGLIKAINSVGYEAVYLRESNLNVLRDLISKGEHIVIDWWSTDCGHYSPVVDISDKEIILADVELGDYRKMDLETFDLNWFDFADYPPRTKDDLLLREMLVIRSRKGK